MNVSTAVDVACIVRTYTPQSRRAAAAWAYTRSTVSQLVFASTASPSNAAKYMSHLADFAAWAHGEGVPLLPRHLLDPEVIERYIAIGMAASRDSTRATRRAILRRVARRCSPAAPEPPRPIAYRRVRPPYTAADVEGLLGLAAAQPTPNRRRTLRAILHLGLGCGLASHDLAWVGGDDVSPLPDGGVQVRVSGGTRPRAVVALAAHEDPLLALAEAAGQRLLIGGTLRGRRNVTRGPLADVVGGEDLPRLEPARLRSTWLLTHLQARTPLPALMQAAGLSTVRPLEDLLHHWPIDPEAARAALRAAG